VYDVTMMSTLRICLARSGEELLLVKELLLEYWHSFGFTPSFQGFDSEVKNLPGEYAFPAGRLALAYIEATVAGCVAMRRLDQERCEAKRLYVRPAFRGQGVGRALLEWLIREARAARYKEMLGDTMPVMHDALAMYERIGFEYTAPYTEQPTPGAIYLRLSL
jgi:putative acetyltransferase